MFFFDKGSVTLLDLIMLPSIIIAPSWRGLFLKKILSIKEEDNSAFKTSPSVLTKSRLVFLSKTINAPVLDFFKFSIAIKSSSILIFDCSWEILNKSLNLLITDLLFVNLLDPSINKNFLISCWNTIINAKTPTLIKPPSILLKIFMLAISVIHQII